VKRILTILALPLLLGSSLPVMGQSGAECATIGADTERLACYDDLFRGGGGAAAPASAASVTLQSEQLIPARPSGRAPATITVSCEAEVLQVAFEFAGNTMSIQGNDTGLTLQYDLQRARSSTLPVNENNTAVLIDNTRDALAFVQGLEGATNLTVRVTPASTRSLNVRFNVSEFDTEIAPVVSACSQ
jgi:type VI secretion system protein VasI